MLAPTVGHNNPPDTIQSAKEAGVDLSAFLKDHPVISSPEEAKLGGAYVERTRINLAAMEDERKVRVEPLNQQLSAINGAYRVVREPLEKILKELRRRLTDYASAVEAARIAEVNRLAAERAEAERIAREAEQREQDAIAMADVGECTDAGMAITEADAAFKTFAKAARAEAIAERNVPVKIASVMGHRGLSMRTVEVLFISNAHAAIDAMTIANGEIPEKLHDALLSCARDHRKAHGELPAGIGSKHERSM